MNSKKRGIIKVEASEVRIPPRPRARPREVFHKIEVIRKEKIRSKRVSEPPHPRLPKQRVAKPLKTLGVRVSVPTLASLPIPTGALAEIRPLQPEPSEEHIRVIRPTNINEAERVVKEAFEAIGAEVMAVLTYIDESTFAYLDHIPKSSSIRILTSVIEQENSVRRAAALQRRSRRRLDVVKLTFIENGREKPLLHERWLSDGNIFIDFGTDLKTRALGAKQHTITIDPADKHTSQIENFEWYWGSEEEKLNQIFNKKVSKKVFFP